MTDLSTAELPKQFATILGKRMAYYEAGAGDPKIAALATEAAIGAPSSSSPSDESATSFCLGRRGLVTGAVLTTATLLILLLISRHTGDGAFEAAGLAPRRAGPP